MTIRHGAAIALLFLLALPARAAEPTDYKTPDKDWARGPVQWILSDDELKEFKRLKTDEERAAFVKAFWEKRDPTPGTPDNEYEIDFWKRVEAADKTFKSMNKPGSLTDKGRVFILLGVPTKTDTDSKGYSIWSYDLAESGGATVHLDLRFAQSDTGGSWMLLDHKDADRYVATHPQTRGIGWKMPAPAAAEAGP